MNGAAELTSIADTMARLPARLGWAVSEWRKLPIVIPSKSAQTSIFTHQSPPHRIGFVGDGDKEIPGRRVGLRSALFPVPHRRQLKTEFQSELFLGHFHHVALSLTSTLRGRPKAFATTLHAAKSRVSPATLSTVGSSTTASPRSN